MPRRDPNARLAFSTAGEVEPEPKPAAPAKARGGIRLRLDRRSGGKLVTLVTDLPGGAAEIAEFARALKTACGAGGTVKDGTVELQGDHRERVEAFLASRGLKSKRAGG